MWGSPPQPGLGLATDRQGRRLTPAAVVEFAVDQVLRNDTDLDALPDILTRIVTAFSGDFALAFQPRSGQPPVVLAAYPGDAAHDRALLARIGALTRPSRDAAGGAIVQVPLEPDPGRAVLLAYSAPVGGQCVCALALAGTAAGWDDDVRSALSAVATAVAAQIRHANAAAGFARRDALGRALLTGSPNAVIAMDSGGRILAFNPAAEALSGYRRADVVGREMSRLVPDRNRAAFAAHIERYLATGDPGEFVGRVRLPLLRADGTERMVELTPAHLNHNGETIFCGFFRDLTELEHTQAALAETEARFGLLAQLAPVGIVQSDADGRALFVNERWCAMIGVYANDALGTRWLDLIHPDDRTRVGQELARITDRGELKIECRLRSSANAEVWVHGAVVALRYAGGQPAGSLAAFTDISDRKRAEAERERLLAAEQAARLSLAGQTERLNCLIAAAIPGVLITDEQGLITHANTSFGEIFGIGSPQRLVGTRAVDLVRQINGMFAGHREFARRALTASRARQPIHGQQIACADGRTLECDYWPVLVGGRYGGDMWLAWDVSERKMLEEQRERLLQAELAARRAAELAQRQLEQQNKQLQELGESRTEFVATVSHELRTPLTSIVSFTELIRAEADSLSPDGVHFLDIVQRNANRLIRLVGDLLLLNRIEAGMVPLELAPVSIPELTQEAVRDASPAAASYGVTLKTAGAADGPAVRGDYLRLRQVLDNLIANAVKFSHPGDVVRVVSGCDDGRWRIDVADTGIGIPPEEIGHLFDRFVRASNARASGRPGTGLGLSVARAIVEVHGGRITVDSALNRGTTFSIYLPVAA